MKRFLFLIFFLVAVVSEIASHDGEAAAVPSHFRYVAPLTGPSPTGTPFVVSLPYSVLSVSESDSFADIRIFDDRNQEVPSIIYRQYAPKSAPRKVFWKVVQYEMVPGRQIITLQRDGFTEGCHSLTVETSARDFRKDIELLDSEDMTSWQPVVSSSMFDFTSQVNLRRTTIETPLLKKPYLRVILTERAEGATATDEELRLRVGTFNLSYNKLHSDELKYDRFGSVVGLPQEERKDYDAFDIPHPVLQLDDQGDTIISLGRLNVPIDIVRISTPQQYFFRTVEFSCLSSEEYRPGTKNCVSDIFRFADLNDADTSLEMRESHCAYGYLKIINQDNPPLDVDLVRIEWIRHNLYFIPQSGRSYSIYAGARGLPKPRYDIHRVIPENHEKLMTYPELSIRRIELSGIYEPLPDMGKKERMEKIILIAVVMMVALALAVWLLSLLKKVKATDSSTEPPQ